MTQNNLGNALQTQADRTDGADALRLLDDAVAAYREALTVFTTEHTPYFHEKATRSLERVRARLAALDR
jgi:hypothetical protein